MGNPREKRKEEIFYLKCLMRDLEGNVLNRLRNHEIEKDVEVEVVCEHE